MSEKLFDVKCRTCCNTAKGLKSLTQKSTDNKCYAELLEEITNINIMDNKYKELPQFICGYCSKRLKSAHAFVQQVKDVNDKLLSILNEKNNLKQELDCLQETQIDIESCLKLKQEEYDEDEIKNNKLECMETNTDSLKDDIVITNKQSLETISKHETAADNEREELLNYIKKEDTIDIEDKNFTINSIMNTGLEKISRKSDSELGNSDQSDAGNKESLFKSDTQNQIENSEDIKDETLLVKTTKIKNKQISQPDDPVGNDVAVPCSKCNKIFLNSKALRVHQRISHIPEERKCTCNLCGSKFTRYCNMYKHMRTFHGPDSVTLMRKPAEGDNVYECNKCSKKYSRKKSLSFHIKTKHLTSPEGKTNGSINLNKTKTEAKQDKGSLCPICGSSFTSKTTLTVHLKRHASERPFKCDLCDRAFVLVNQLNSHKRLHTGEKPYKCQLCTKAFRVSDHLRRHMRSHTDDRPYKCSQCERSFKYSEELSKHLRSNRSVRPYGSICDNSLPKCIKNLKANFLKVDETETLMNQNVSLHMYIN